MTRSLLVTCVLFAVSSACPAEATPPAAAATSWQESAIACDASRDERPRLAAALASGGLLAGRTLVLESGCRVLLGSPGPGRAALKLASNTRVECADGTAGFVLARRSCHGGELPGAACDLANHHGDCPGGGTCTSDVESGPFAPEADSTYTVIAAEQGSVAAAVIGCSIWVNGVSGDSIAAGGSGARYGFCHGGQNAGFSCSQRCSPEAGVLAGFVCTCDADCHAPGARCLPPGQCGDTAGTCGSPPPRTPWGPSGKGYINPIDLESSVGAAVKDVRIYDHRKGRFAIRVGSGGRRVEQIGIGQQANTTTFGTSSVRNCTTDAATTSLTPVGILSAEVYDPRPFVETGIIGGAFDSVISDNHVAAYRFGIRAYSSSTVTGNTVKLPTNVMAGALPSDAAPGGDGLPSGIGLLASGDNSTFIANRVGAYIGFMLEPEHGFNVTVSSNRFLGGTGAKVAIPSGSGALINGNYMAWGSSDNLDCTGPGQPSACCDGGGTGRCTGPGVIRIGSGDPVARAGSTNHVDIIGNLIHSEQPYATYVLFDAAGRRCVKGDRAYDTCAADTDCPDVASCDASGRPRACCDGRGSGSCVSSCRATEYGNSFISSNHFHSGTAKQTALDLSRLAYDATTISGMTVGGNRIARFGRGVVLPADARTVERLVFLANDFEGTASPSDLCTGPATPFGCCSAAGMGTCSVYEGWNWSMGERKGDAGLTPADEQPVTVTLASSRAVSLRAGDVVAVSEEAGGVGRAISTSDATGIALTDTTGGVAVTVAVSGVASCKVSAPVVSGARLAIGAKPGELEMARGGPSIAVALASARAGQLVRCLLSPRS